MNHLRGGNAVAITIRARRVGHYPQAGGGPPPDAGAGSSCGWPSCLLLSSLVTSSLVTSGHEVETESKVYQTLALEPHASNTATTKNTRDNRKGPDKHQSAPGT